MVTRRLRARFLAGTVMAIAAIASIGGGAVLAADRAVAIAGFAFAPPDVTVTVGDTVTWTNSDATAHTATADDGSFDTGTIGANGTGTATFSTAGSFPYHCKIHSSMTGTITVEAAAGGSGSGSGATTPPSDTDPAIAASAEVPLGSLLAIVGAGLVAFMFARRRFARD